LTRIGVAIVPDKFEPILVLSTDSPEDFRCEAGDKCSLISAARRRDGLF
jgi:hypothetical protein